MLFDKLNSSFIRTLHGFWLYFVEPLFYNFQCLILNDTKKYNNEMLFSFSDEIWTQNNEQARIKRKKIWRKFMRNGVSCFNIHSVDFCYNKHQHLPEEVKWNVLIFFLHLKNFPRSFFLLFPLLPFRIDSFKTFRL